MAVPAMVLIFLPLYFLKKHMIDRCNGDDTNGTKENNVINDGDKKSTIDGIENGNVRCDEMLNNSDTSLVRTYAAKTTSSFGTEPTVRQSRLDTDGTLDYSIPSADYFRNLDPCNSCVVEVGLGRRLKEDENYVFSHPSIRNDNDHPPNLQHVVEFDLPVGFYRLRKAMLGSESTFWTDVIMRDSLRYSRITQGQWDQHHHYIGLPTPTPHTNTLTESDFLNTTRKTSFLMPQTAILKPSMAHETATITQYSPNEFTITILTLTPDVPFGSKIVSHTQIAVANTGNLTCHMTCSCEVTFPTGAPSMGFGAQIKKQSKLASVNTFHKIAGAIRTCVEEDNDVYSNYSEGDANSFVYDLNKTSGAPRLVLKSPKLELTDMPSIIFASADGRNDDVDDDDDDRLKIVQKKDYFRKIRQWGTERKTLMSKSKRKLQKKIRTRRRSLKSDSEVLQMPKLQTKIRTRRSMLKSDSEILQMPKLQKKIWTRRSRLKSDSEVLQVPHFM